MRGLWSFILCSCTVVVAQSNSLGFTSVPTSIRAGEATVLSYNAAPDADAPVTITLRKGNPSDLDTIGTLTSSATGGKYTWIPANCYADGSDYALQIQQGREVNYSGAISISGGDASAIPSAFQATQSLSSVGAALTSSYARSQSVASIQSILSSYSAALANLTGLPSSTGASMSGAFITGGGTGSTSGASSSSGSLAEMTSFGTGMPISRNTTMMTPGPSTTTRVSTSTSSDATSSSTGAAAAPARQGVLTGSSPLALVLAAVVCMML